MDFSKTSSISNSNINKSPLQLNNNLAKNNSSENQILAKRGDAGYIKAMDLDNDGSISMDEFNQYCEDNKISGDARIKLLMVMNVANTSEILNDKQAEIRKQKEEKTKEDEENSKSEADEESKTFDKNIANKPSYEEYVENLKKFKEEKVSKYQVKYKNESIKKAVISYESNKNQEVTTSKENAVYEENA